MHQVLKCQLRVSLSIASKLLDAVKLRKEIPQAVGTVISFRNRVKRYEDKNRFIVNIMYLCWFHIHFCGRHVGTKIYIAIVLA